MEAPSSGWAWTNDFAYNNEAQKRDFPIAGQFADTSYFKTFGISLIAGRLPFHSDTARELVVNEALVHKLGIEIGRMILLVKYLTYGGWDHGLEVVGVFKDYNNKSFVNPSCRWESPTNYNAYEWIAVRMDRRTFRRDHGQSENAFHRNLSNLSV